MPIGSSLWLDKLVTFWSAYKGIVPAIGRAQFWPGQNTAYTVLIAAIIRVAGTSEIALRLPSLFALVLTAWLLFRLGEYFIDKEAGILVVVVFTSLHEVAKEGATNARPYGIALLLVVASMLQLVRWLLIIWLLQQAPIGSVEGCPDQRFPRRFASFSPTLPPRRPARSIWRLVAGQMGLFAFDAGT